MLIYYPVYFLLCYLRDRLLPGLVLNVLYALDILYYMCAHVSVCSYVCSHTRAVCVPRSLGTCRVDQ